MAVPSHALVRVRAGGCVATSQQRPLCIGHCGDSQDASRVIPGQYIVVFKGYDDLTQGASVVQADVQTSSRKGGVLAQFDSLFHGLTVACSDAALDRLAALPGVLAIVPDAIISLDETQQLDQVGPCGSLWTMRAGCTLHLIRDLGRGLCTRVHGHEHDRVCVCVCACVLFCACLCA